MARPKTKIDEDMLRKLARMQCTIEEIASFFECSVRTIQRHFKSDNKLKEILEEGKARGRISIRRAQFDHLINGDRTMAIFLGKVYLNQIDRPQPFDQSQDTPIGEVNFSVKPSVGEVKVTNASK